MQGFVQRADRQQTTLLPECLDDWVDESNAVRAVDVFVDALELRDLGFDGVDPAATGRPAYHPSPMLKLYIYGYLNRVQSSRRLEREAGRNLEVMWLTGRLVPDHKTNASCRHVVGNTKKIRKPTNKMDDPETKRPIALSHEGLVARLMTQPPATFCPRQIAFHGALLYSSNSEIGWPPRMPITENTSRRLVLKSGSTTLTLDKEVGKATLQRKFLLWGLKPVEADLSDIAEFTVDTAVDRASGVEICHTMVVFRNGAGWAFPAENKVDAQTNATLMHIYLGPRA